MYRLKPRPLSNGVLFERLNKPSSQQLLDPITHFRLPLTQCDATSQHRSMQCRSQRVARAQQSCTRTKFSTCVYMAERWCSMQRPNAASVQARTHPAAVRHRSKRPGEHPLYGDVPSHGVCFTKSVASFHPTARQATVISRACVIVGTHAGS